MKNTVCVIKEIRRKGEQVEQRLRTPVSKGSALCVEIGRAHV